MEFGRLEDRELLGAEFNLPPDGEHTKFILNQGKRVSQPAFHVGCAKWGRKEWAGLLYPKLTKERDFLAEYAKHFDSIELNAVFFSMPNKELLSRWKHQVAINGSDNFLFFPRLNRAITHIGRLKDVGENNTQFFEALKSLKPYLGPCIAQLSDNFKPIRKLDLENYLNLIPTGTKMFIELRHESWFSDEQVRREILKKYAEKKVGTVITDTVGRRDCVHMELTIPEVYIRFAGNGGDYWKSDIARVDEWILRLKEWLDRGLEKIYFIVHQHDEDDTPVLAKYVIDRFNSELGAKLKPITLIEK